MPSKTYLGMTALTASIAVGVCVLPAANAGATHTEGPSTMAAVAAPAGFEKATDAPTAGKSYLLNNEAHRAWSDDGVKGSIKNFTKKHVTVKDRRSGKLYHMVPGAELVYYSDADLRGNSGCDAGGGAYLEFSERGDQFTASSFWLSDAWFGRPDTVFEAPHSRVNNVRKSWKVGNSHHEHAGKHKFWIKRESDSWREKFDNWNTSDWPAFTIHIESI